MIEIVRVLMKLLSSRRRDIDGRLANIEDRLEQLTRASQAILRSLREVEGHEMATQETLDRMIADVTANTDAVAAATAAMNLLVQSNADLTQQLQDAIANGDEAAVKAAADAIEVNNAMLMAAIPATAKAIVAGTPASEV